MPYDDVALNRIGICYLQSEKVNKKLSGLMEGDAV